MRQSIDKAVDRACCNLLEYKQGGIAESGLATAAALLGSAV
jgi:hypothetical protein